MWGRATLKYCLNTGKSLNAIIATVVIAFFALTGPIGWAEHALGQESSRPTESTGTAETSTGTAPTAQPSSSQEPTTPPLDLAGSGGSDATAQPALPTSDNRAGKTLLPGQVMGGTGPQPTPSTEPFSEPPAPSLTSTGISSATAQRTTLSGTEAATAPASAQAMASSAPSAGGEDGLQPLQPTAPFNGEFVRSIGIAVPPYHGIEPKLSLTYASNQTIRNIPSIGGWLGIGWSLSGLSVIERASPGKGVPRFDTTDIYLLDGQEMIACQTGTPGQSCATGGTHAMRVETFERIKRDATPAVNTWEVTQTDGTKLLYKALGDGQSYGTGTDEVTLATNYRWLLRSVTDMHGNVVNYTYSCATFPDCYIDTITYNGATIKFWREARPETVTWATGTSILGTTTQRMKTIDVSVTQGRSRAYKLTYAATNPSTPFSRLTGVQQFGKDAVIDASGSITSGTSLPAYAMTYTDTANAFTSGTAVTVTTYDIIADFDGDNLSDIADATYNSSTVHKT